MMNEMIIPTTDINNTQYPRHAVDKYKVCPFKEVTAAVKNKITGTRCSPNCMLFNIEENDCNINVIAGRYKCVDLLPAQYINVCDNDGGATTGTDDEVDDEDN